MKRVKRNAPVESGIREWYDRESHKVINNSELRVKWWDKYFRSDYSEMDPEDDFMPELVEDYGEAEWICTLIPKQDYNELPVMDLIAIGDRDPEPILYIGGRAIPYTERDVLREIGEDIYGSSDIDADDDQQFKPGKIMNHI